jgi:hypothetical protein
MVAKLVKKFPTFYETWRFFTVFTSRLNVLVPVSIRTLIHIFSPQFPKLPGGLFFSGSSTTIQCAFLRLMRAICLAHLILLDVIIQIIFVDKYKLWHPSLCSFLHPAVASPLSQFSRMLPFIKHPDLISLQKQVKRYFYIFELSRF